jgi:hypothetical protein
MFTRGEDIGCVVCQGGTEITPVRLCRDCMHFDRVRTYCCGCRARTDLSLRDAHELYPAFREQIDRTGIVYRYDVACPACNPEQALWVVTRFDLLPNVLPLFPRRPP